jgi:hypothetical protein
MLAARYSESGPTEKSSRLPQLSAVGGGADQICSRRGFQPVTQIGHAAHFSDSASTDEVYVDVGTFSERTNASRDHRPNIALGPRWSSQRR